MVDYQDAKFNTLFHVPLQVGPRVHFKLQPQQAIIPEKKKSPPSSLTNGNGKSIRPQSFTPGLKRSKSLTSADALASGMAALGLAADAGDLGNFPPEIQECIDKALEGKCFVKLISFRILGSR